jgi:hypothetical protein
MLRVNNEQKKFELPYPFFSETKGLTAEMNYSLNEIAHNCDHLYFKLKSITPKTNAKIYDNVVYIVGE